MRDPVARKSGNILTLELDRAMRRHLAHDGLDRRGTPNAIASQKTHDLAGVDVHVHALQDMALAVIGVKVLNLQHQAASSPR